MGFHSKKKKKERRTCCRLDANLAATPLATNLIVLVVVVLLSPVDELSKFRLVFLSHADDGENGSGLLVDHLTKASFSCKRLSDTEGEYKKESLYP